MPRDLELQDLILAFLAEHPGNAYKPSEIAAGLSEKLNGRHLGGAAVLNTCRNLADSGRIRWVAYKPMTFTWQPNDDGTQA